MRWLSLLFITLTAAIGAMVSTLSGLVSYGPLQHLAEIGVSYSLAAWWPLLVFGPWLVATLSILRAAVHHRRSRHSWVVVVFFTAVAAGLCVAHAPMTHTGMAVAGLPPITALVCFHQLVRQITLTQPPPRTTLPRQRAASHVRN